MYASPESRLARSRLPHLPKQAREVDTPSGLKAPSSCERHRFCCAAGLGEAFLVLNRLVYSFFLGKLPSISNSPLYIHKNQFPSHLLQLHQPIFRPNYILATMYVPDIQKIATAGLALAAVKLSTAYQPHLFTLDSATPSPRK